MTYNKHQGALLPWEESYGFGQKRGIFDILVFFSAAIRRTTMGVILMLSELRWRIILKFRRAELSSASSTRPGSAGADKIGLTFVVGGHI
jgi:hypothetical protein